ncbi:MAG: hemin uptake protein HemP [Gemmatimonas sp.]
MSFGATMETRGESKDRVAPRASAEPPRRIASSALLGDGREIVIVHHSEEYRLRITKNGKLILTK